MKCRLVTSGTVPCRAPVATSTRPRRRAPPARTPPLDGRRARATRAPVARSTGAAGERGRPGRAGEHGRAGAPARARGGSAPGHARPAPGQSRPAPGPTRPDMRGGRARTVAPGQLTRNGPPRKGGPRLVEGWSRFSRHAGGRDTACRARRGWRSARRTAGTSTAFGARRVRRGPTGSPYSPSSRRHLARVGAERRPPVDVERGDGRGPRGAVVKVAPVVGRQLDAVGAIVAVPH